MQSMIDLGNLSQYCWVRSRETVFAVTCPDLRVSQVKCGRGHQVRCGRRSPGHPAAEINDLIFGIFVATAGSSCVAERLFRFQLFECQLFNRRMFNCQLFNRQLFDCQLFDCQVFDFQMFDSLVFDCQVFDCQIF